MPHAWRPSARSLCDVQVVRQDMGRRRSTAVARNGEASHEVVRCAVLQRPRQRDGEASEALSTERDGNSWALLYTTAPTLDPTAAQACSGIAWCAVLVLGPGWREIGHESAECPCTQPRDVSGAQRGGVTTHDTLAGLQTHRCEETRAVQAQRLVTWPLDCPGWRRRTMSGIPVDCRRRRFRVPG